MSKIKNGGLDQYGAEPFEQQQFGTAGVEGVNVLLSFLFVLTLCRIKIIIVLERIKITYKGDATNTD